MEPRTSRRMPRDRASLDMPKWMTERMNQATPDPQPRRASGSISGYYPSTTPVPDALEASRSSGRTESPIGSQVAIAPVITSDLSPSEILASLTSWGCTELTSRLNSQSCSEYPVGTGGFGDVYSGVLVNGARVAIKAIRPLSADGLSAGKYQKRTAKELYAWSRCRHQNIARLLGFSVFRGRLAMISEWAEHGNIAAYLTKEPSADRCALSIDVCRGLAYLHSQNIVHGDLKGANVLVSRKGDAMLIDFGNASLVDSTVSFTTTGNKSFSLRWTAPEILKESSPVSCAGDVYGLGMTTLEIITGQVPFYQLPDRSIYTAVVNKRRLPTRPEDKIPLRSVCGNVLWALLEQCWAREPRLRPNAEQAKNIMQGITQEALSYIEPDPESEDEL